MNLRIFDDLDALSRAAARTIFQRDHRSVAISGGSTPVPLYELLSKEIRAEDPIPVSRRSKIFWPISLAGTSGSSKSCH